jgi:Asp-tRNA(Asn)/Glu-tRNA(Gln) amidotransferase B subunit
MREQVPEAPGTRIRRLEVELGFGLAEGLVTSGRDELYSRTGGEDRRAVANVVMNELAATGLDPSAVKAEELRKLIEARDRIPRDAFIAGLEASGRDDFKADDFLGEALIADAGELDPVIDRVLAAHPEQVASYKAGKEGLLGFLVGQVMRETKGKASPQMVNELLRERLKS